MIKLFLTSSPHISQNANHCQIIKVVIAKTIQLRHSTSLSLTLLEAMDKKQISIVVFIDLSKAFDSIEHDILLEKISRLGVSPAAHEWFKSYLADRSQYVRIGTTTSTTAPLTHGIPQGSVLSPFLFNIYTDSLPSIPEFCNDGIFLTWTTPKSICPFHYRSWTVLYRF